MMAMMFKGIGKVSDVKQAADLVKKLAALGIAPPVADLFVKTADVKYAAQALDESLRRTCDLTETVHALVRERNYSLSEVTLALVYLLAVYQKRSYYGEPVSLEEVIENLPLLYLDAVRAIIHGIGDMPVLEADVDEQ